jgi:hypothetical protein
MNSPATFEYYFTLKHNGRARVKNPFRCLISISVAALCISAIGPKSAKGHAPAESVANSPTQIRALKITVLSTMLVGENLGNPESERNGSRLHSYRAAALQGLQDLVLLKPINR